MKEYVIAIAAAITLTIAWMGGYGKAQIKYESEIAEMQKVSIEKYNSYLVEKDEIIRKYNTIISEMNYEHEQTIAELNKDHNSAIADVANDYRLLDKSNVLVTAKHCDPSTYTCTFKATDAGVKLSKEATLFLLNLTSEADNDRANLNLCKKTLQNIYKVVDEHNAAAINN